jgi:hypothetical protein
MGASNLWGQYAEQRLRLNRRHLVEIRSLLNEIADLKGVSWVDWNRPVRDQVISLVPDF